MQTGPEKKFDAIFWDNDGILVDTEGLYFEANREVLGREGVELTHELFREYFLLQSFGVRSLLSGLPEHRIEEIRALRDALFAKMLQYRELAIPGALDTLKSLHGRYRMGIVTSCRADHFALIHKSTSLLDYVEFILTPDCYSATKPDPAPYLKAVELVGSAPERCLAIEDSARGLFSAKAAGIACWVIPSSLTAGSDFSAADRIVENIKAAATLLLEGAGT